MLKNITIGQYFPADSVVHRMDPRMKIALASLYVVMIFLINNFWGYLALFGYIALVAVLSHLPLKFVFKSLKPLRYILLFTFFLNMFLIQGETLLISWAFIRITQQGFVQAAFLALRLIFLVVGTSVLTLTTSPIAITDGMERLLKPLKLIRFPVHELAMMMTIALRFIPTLIEEVDKIMKAQMARGADFESGKIVQRVKAMIPLLVPLFVSAFRRAEDLAMAMESRCYRGGKNRTRMKELHLAGRDFVGLLILLSLAVIIIVV